MTKKGFSDMGLVGLFIVLLLIAILSYILIKSPTVKTPDPKDIVNQGMMIPLLGSYLWNKLFNKSS